MKKCLFLGFILMFLFSVNVFAADRTGYITDRTGTIIGSGSLEANSENATAITFSDIENQTVTTRIRYASERDLGAWVGGGSLVHATSAGVSGVINMCESYHKIGSFDIGLIVYF